MSTILTFCTAEVPVEVYTVPPHLRRTKHTNVFQVIQRFIKESQRTENSYKCWSLVREPNQATFDESTKTPVSAFQSGFIGASFDTLVKFVKELPEDKKPRFFTDQTFAVLDERSLKDNTVVLYKYNETMPKELMGTYCRAVHFLTWISQEL
jgi:hypothetical protein